MRSKWKKNIFVYNKKLTRRKIIYKKAYYIAPSLLNKRVRIYNGKSAIPILIKRNMLGLRLGTFIVTKTLGARIHTKKKRKKNSIYIILWAMLLIL